MVKHNKKNKGNNNLCKKEVCTIYLCMNTLWEGIGKEIGTSNLLAFINIIKDELPVTFMSLEITVYPVIICVNLHC
jgi:hypothetical protein